MPVYVPLSTWTEGATKEPPESEDLPGPDEPAEAEEAVVLAAGTAAGVEAWI